MRERWRRRLWHETEGIEGQRGGRLVVGEVTIQESWGKITGVRGVEDTWDEERETDWSCEMKADVGGRSSEAWMERIREGGQTRIVIVGPSCISICVSVSRRWSNSGAGTQTPLSLANTAPETSSANVSLCAFTGVGERPYGAFDARMIKSKSSNESKEMDEMDVGK